MSRAKAEAEIYRFDARIQSRRMTINNLVDRDWIQLNSMRDKAAQQRTTVESRTDIYRQKLDAYANGGETVDNLIRVRKDLYGTQLDLSYTLADLFHTITRLDRACNVYFQELDIGVALTGN